MHETGVVTDRRCPICGSNLSGRRADARYRGGRCRAEASRLSRLFTGEQVDGYESPEEWREGARAARGDALSATGMSALYETVLLICPSGKARVRQWSANP